MRNKAGSAGKDALGRERYYSYGSTTADGDRCLITCGSPLTHPRVVAVLQWLQRNFNVVEHPGMMVPENEPMRPAVYYYYCWSLAEALEARRLTR